MVGYEQSLKTYRDEKIYRLAVKALNVMQTVDLRISLYSAAMKYIKIEHHDYHFFSFLKNSITVFRR